MADPIASGEYAGIRVDYFESPHRHYLVNGEKVPSVTTVLGLLHKPLENWVERITLDGAWRLLTSPKKYSMPKDRAPSRCPWRDRKYVPGFAYKCKTPVSDCVGGDPRLCQFRVDLKNRRLDAHGVKNAAADRGVDVHQVWQDWNERKKIPNASDYPQDRHGYIRSMAKFIMEHQPECREVEMVVGSAEHGFAGRLDTVVVLDMGGTLSMVDVKTSKAVYRNSHFPQLAGYEIARRECGLEPTDRQGILRLRADGGDAELAWSDACSTDFLAILTAWKSQQRWARRGR